MERKRGCMDCYYRGYDDCPSHLRINRSGIVRVEQISSSVVKNSFRVGSGGPFGYWGRWQNDTLGWYTLFATSLKDLLLIRLSDGRTYIISSRTLLLSIKHERSW